ncbi:MAG: hypothetical protein PVG71_15730 [Anaerolineae bacterium]|jgi:hypothetical protein
MSTQDDRNARKFEEPRSWAAKWCGYGLTAKRRRRESPPHEGEKFGEPRGWSAKWCDGGLGSERPPED